MKGIIREIAVYLFGGAAIAAFFLYGVMNDCVWEDDGCYQSTHTIGRF